MEKSVKIVKLRSSNIKVRLMVLPKNEILYLAGFIVADSQRAYKSQIIYCFCENYLTDVVPHLVGKDKKYRMSVFEELYKAICEYNPEVEKSWRPIAGNSSSTTILPIMMLPGAGPDKDKLKVKKKALVVEKEKVRSISKELCTRVFGQDDVLCKIQEYFECALAGIGEPGKPRGSFIFVGDTGTGKTLVVKEIAKHFWGKDWRDGLFIINGSEMMEEHETAKLLGSPQGYVGYDDGSPFLKHIAKNPESIILVDEFEKAHPRMQDVFLQILDEGTCYDNKGNGVDFSKTLIVFTSNIGTREVYHKNKMGFGDQQEAQEKVDIYVNSALRKFCRVEFLKRFSGVVVFNVLSAMNYVDIARAEVGYVVDRLEEKCIRVEVSDEVYEKLASYLEKGDTARDLKSEVKTRIEIPIAKLLITDDDYNSMKVLLKGDEIVVEGVKVGKTSQEGC